MIAASSVNPAQGPLHEPSPLPRGVLGRFSHAWDLRLTRVRVAIPALPAHLQGLRLAHVSDTHLGRLVPASFIRRAVDAALALQPHAFLLTGDYIDDGTSRIAEAARLLAPLARAGVPAAAVLGNHDWYGCGRSVRAALQDQGFEVIDNARLFLLPGRPALAQAPAPDALCIAGLGDLDEDHVDLHAALEGVPDHVPRLVLAHNPDTAELPQVRSGPRIDLMLSGHTHGGQIRLPFLGTPVTMSRYGSKYAAGLVQGPVCPVQVSRGVGLSIAPIRWGVRPEIVEVTLTPR